MIHKGTKEIFSKLVLFGVILMIMYTCKQYTSVKEPKVLIKQVSFEKVEVRKEWISMSVCWSSNTKFHGKKKHPYKYAMKLSVRLWSLVTNHTSIIQVVHDKADEDKPELALYVSELESLGAIVFPVVTDPNVMECSFKSQLVRLFAYQYEDIIDDDDIIITADADTFVAAEDSLRHLKIPQYKGWIYQYSHTLIGGGGETFPMDYLAFKSKTWQEMIGKGGVDTPEKLVEKYRPVLNLSLTNTWDHDQKIITRVILEKGICSLPKGHLMWKAMRLDPKIFAVNDSESCFHGMGQWMDCNQDRKIIKTGCIKYHFYPK